MPLIAITRPVSPNINDCELSFHARQPIDFRKAIAQHADYQNCLSALGLKVVSLPPEPDLPDAVFVEDPAVVLDEVAIISIMGAPSRRPETDSLASALSRYRPIKRLITPATLEGGDVMRIGRRIFVGLTQRTNQEGFRQLRETLSGHDYQVESVAVNGCLHLKSACSYVGHNSILINRALVDSNAFQDFQLIDVAEDEDAGANALVIGEVVIMPASFPKTRALLERRGFRVQTVDLSELQKAEAGVTCTSLIFTSNASC
jgi:dimethylargininase